MFIRFVRPPHTSSYNDVDVREDAIITYALGRLCDAGANEWDVRDFHLDNECEFSRLLGPNVDAFVVTVRETGANVHYARRLAAALARETSRPILLYGQTGRLSKFEDLPSNVRLIRHDEEELVAALGLSSKGPRYVDGLRAQPYFTALSLSPDRRRRLKASVETSRGCPYGCRFCFINHGRNYPERRQLRSVEGVIEDILTYARLGVRFVVLHDSELLGNRNGEYAQHRELFSRLERHAPGTRLKIYARADTLLRFGEFDLLKAAGVADVFIGVESFAQSDLDAMRKSLTVSDVIRCVSELSKRGIYQNLSFMLFNSNTSIATLRENLRHLKTLAASDDRRFLGMPNFLFSFEADWTGDAPHLLTDRSYVRWMVWKREQPGVGVTFDSLLEPLVEVCRVAFYDLACKITAVNRAGGVASQTDTQSMDRWFTLLWPFSVSVLEVFLNLFDRGVLTMNSLPQAITDLYAMLSHFYQLLPAPLRGLETYEDHGRRLIAAEGPIPLEDHGWDAKIPGGIERNG